MDTRTLREWARTTWFKALLAGLAGAGAFLCYDFARRKWRRPASKRYTPDGEATGNTSEEN